MKYGATRWSSLRAICKQTVDNLNQESAGYGDVSFNDFGNLAFEKYSALRFGESAKRTWSFRIEFSRGNLSVRYLFFFGYGSHTIRKRCSVTLHIAREEPPNSYNYERLRNIDSTSVPNLTEIGYDMEKERFVICRRTDRSFMATVEQFGKKFFEEIVGLC